MELGCEYILTVKILRKKPAVARVTPTVHLTSQGLGDLNADLDESSPTRSLIDESSHGTFFTRGRGFGWEVWEGLAWPESITSFKSQPGRSFHIPHTIAPRIKPLFTFFWQEPDSPEKQVLNNIDNLFDQIWAAAGQLLWCKTKTSQNPFADFSTQIFDPKSEVFCECFVVCTEYT